MARVEIAESAAAAIRELADTRELPPSALPRVRLNLRTLERFPKSGQLVADGPFADARVFTGPWWFVFVYVFDETADVVTVTAAFDGRTAGGSSARGS